jgi:hypothetical protein
LYFALLIIITLVIGWDVLVDRTGATRAIILDNGTDCCHSHHDEALVDSQLQIIIMVASNIEVFEKYRHLLACINQ